MLSSEFERRCRGLPQDTQLCELANPAKWDNEAWLDAVTSKEYQRWITLNYTAVPNTA